MKTTLKTLLQSSAVLLLCAAFCCLLAMVGSR